MTSSSYSPTVHNALLPESLRNVRGGKRSKLILLPFNQASVRDLQALVKYIYAEDGLNMDLDFVVPFAAISENGRSITEIDSKSELAHRLMLTNTIRLLGSDQTAEAGPRHTNKTCADNPSSFSKSWQPGQRRPLCRVEARPRESLRKIPLGRLGTLPSDLRSDHRMDERDKAHFRNRPGSTRDGGATVYKLFRKRKWHSISWRS